MVAKIYEYTHNLWVYRVCNEQHIQSNDSLFRANLPCVGHRVVSSPPTLRPRRMDDTSPASFEEEGAAIDSNTMYVGKRGGTREDDTEDQQSAAGAR